MAYVRDMGTSRSENLGKVIGRACRYLAATPARAAKLMIDLGVPPGIAKPLGWLLVLAVFVGVLYAMPWLLVLLVLIVAIGSGSRRNPSEGEDWFPKPTDHRDEPFYHPLSYNDDPDPRFRDK